MTGISLVVAARPHAPAVAGMLASLRGELRPEDEVVWVCCDGTGSGPDPPDATRVIAAPTTNRGEANALGFARARAPIVAFTDAETVLCPGWRTAAEKVVEEGAVAVGGPVSPSRPRTLRSWAGFFVEYGPHAVFPYTSATGDVSANNVAYRRSALRDVVDGPAWKSVVNARLTAKGLPIRVEPGMRVISAKTYGWRDLLPSRVAHGRLYGAQRAASWSTARRLIRALGCAALPIVALRRLGRSVWRDRGLRLSFVGSLPLVAAALVAWSLGEAVGYVLGHDDERGLW